MSEPAGIVLPFAGSVAPQGYLLCDGSAVSRTDYADLFSAIGTVYGAGDGVSTFNLPDLSGRVVLGVSQSHALGSTGGESTHTLTENELPAHTHTVPSHGHADNITATTPVLTHTITQAVFKYNSPNRFTTGGSGMSDNYCNNGTMSATASRSTNLAVSAHAAASCTVSGSISDCAAFDTEQAGASDAHNNMQPYSVMKYIISIGG
jgi:microcystin-dependent protein